MTRSDFVVILLVIISLGFLYDKYWSFNTQQNTHSHYAKITITGSTPQKLVLDEDKIININGRIGKSIIEIKNKKIRFLSSPCIKKYCIHSGWLSKTGSTAVCMPNGIIISIKSLTNSFDAINF